MEVMEVDMDIECRNAQREGVAAAAAATAKTQSVAKRVFTPHP